MCSALKASNSTCLHVPRSRSWPLLQGCKWTRGWQIIEAENRNWRSAAEIKVSARTGGDEEDNQCVGSGGQTQQGQGGAHNQPETHRHGPKIRSYWTKGRQEKKAMGAVCKGKNFQHSGPRRGFKAEGRWGGKRAKSLGLVPHILGICSHSGIPEQSGDVFVSLIKSDSSHRFKKPFAHTQLPVLPKLKGCKILSNLTSKINFIKDENRML